MLLHTLAALLALPATAAAVSTVWTAKVTWRRIVGETADALVVEFPNATACGLRLGAVSRTTGVVLWQHEFAAAGDATQRRAPTVSDGSETPSSVGSGVVVVAQAHYGAPPTGCIKTSLTGVDAKTGATRWSMPPMVRSPYSLLLDGAGGTKCVLGGTTDPSFLRYAATGVVLTSRVCVAESCRFSGAPDVPTVIIEALQCDATPSTPCTTLAWRWGGDTFTNCVAEQAHDPSCSALYTGSVSDIKVYAGREPDIATRGFLPSPGMNVGKSWAAAPPLFRVTFVTSQPASWKTIGFDASSGTTLCAPDMEQVFANPAGQVGHVQCDVSIPRTRGAWGNEHQKQKQKRYPHGLLQCWRRYHDSSFTYVGDPHACDSAPPGLAAGWRNVFASGGDIDADTSSVPSVQGEALWGAQQSWGAADGCRAPNGTLAPPSSTVPALTAQCGLAFLDMTSNKSTAMWVPRLPTTLPTVFCTNGAKGPPTYGSGACTLSDGTPALRSAFQHVTFVRPWDGDAFTPSPVFSGGVTLLRARSPMGDAKNTAVENHTLLAYVAAGGGTQVYATTLGWPTLLNWTTLLGVTTNNVPRSAAARSLFGAGVALNATQSVVVVFDAQKGTLVWESPPLLSAVDSFDFSRFDGTEFSFVNANGVMEYCRVE